MMAIWDNTMHVELPIEGLAKRIEVEVTIKGWKGWIVRLWIAKQLIILAGLISGMGFELMQEDGRPTD